MKSSAEDKENTLVSRADVQGSDFHCYNEQNVGNFTLTKGLVKSSFNATAALVPRNNKDSIYKSQWAELNGYKHGVVEAFHEQKGMAGIVFSVREWLRHLNFYISSNTQRKEEPFSCNKNGEFDMRESAKDGGIQCNFNVHWWETMDLPFRTRMNGNGNAIAFRGHWNGKEVYTTGPTDNGRYTVYAPEGKGGGTWGGKQRAKPSHGRNGVFSARWYCYNEAGTNNGNCANNKYMQSYLTRMPFPYWSKKMIAEYWNRKAPITSVFYTIVPEKAVKDNSSTPNKIYRVLIFIDAIGTYGCKNQIGAQNVKVETYLDVHHSAFVGFNIHIKHPEHCLSGKVNLDQPIEYDFCAIMAKGGCHDSMYMTPRNKDGTFNKSKVEWCSSFAGSSSVCNISTFPNNIKDSIVQGICAVWPRHPECICHARVSWQDFLQRGGFVKENTPHVCWWQPCKDDAKGVLKTSQDNSKGVSCGDFCINYADYENIGDSKFGNINMIVVCNRNQGSGPPPPSSPPSPPGVPPPGAIVETRPADPDPAARTDKTDKTKTKKEEKGPDSIWFVVLAVVSFLFLAGLGYYFYSKQQPALVPTSVSAPAPAASAPTPAPVSTPTPASTQT